MTAALNQPTLTPWQRHRNAQLFSDHYLNHILPGRADWQMLAAQSVAVPDQLRKILAAYQPSSNEADTEYRLVRPVLEALGHTLGVQPSLKVPDGTKKPDYVLYNDPVARAGLKNKVLDDALLKGAAFGVAEAKYWDRSLDKALTGAGDAFNNKNPAYQIAFYVQHSGVTWGILTNGCLWRLVHKDTAAADLYVYFYRRGLELAREGGRLSYIVNNKWLRAGYGAPLRGYFGCAGHVERLVDFGHAPIFPDVDTFPCILLIRKGTPEDGAATEICQFPREEWGKSDLSPYVCRNSYLVPFRRFGSGPWSLERDDIDALMAKIRQAGVPLSEYIGGKVYYGIKTGLNEAFLVDTPTRDRLVTEDAKASALLVPYLRGQDIKRWTPGWAGLWMILLKSSENQTWPWSELSEKAEKAFALSYPSLYHHVKPLEDALRARPDQGRFWWELRSCRYYDHFSRPKIMYQVIQFYPAYCSDTEGHLCNDKGFMFPKLDAYLLGVLNSPLMWWHNWRYFPHMKDEALNPKGDLMEKLAIAQPTDAVRDQIEDRVRVLLAASEDRRTHRQQVLDWLQVEFDVESPGQKLSTVETLDEAGFVDEVRARRPRTASRLTPAALHDLKQAYAAHVVPLRALIEQMAVTERQVAVWVNEAYGLTAEEVALMRKTAPPRMPAF